MNVAQMVQLALYQADAVSQTRTSAYLYAAPELYAWANDANRKLEKRLRAAADDYFVRRLNSADDTTAQKIMGIDYTPATSLALTASTRTVTLPPDFLSLRSIRCVSSGYEDTHFYQMDLTHARFQSMLRDTAEAAPGEDLYYDIQGERTLYLAQPVSSALDVEIAYVARTKPLVMYSAGTVAVTTGTTAVTGSGTTWSTGTPFDTSYLDIHFGVSAVASVPIAEPHLAYESVTLGRVASVTTDTALVLASNKVGTLSAGTGYLLASIPVLPEEYHQAIADWVTACILQKIGHPGHASYAAKYAHAATETNTTLQRRQAAQVETVEAWSPWED